MDLKADNSIVQTIKTDHLFPNNPIFNDLINTVWSLDEENLPELTICTEEPNGYLKDNDLVSTGNKIKMGEYQTVKVLQQHIFNSKDLVNQKINYRKHIEIISAHKCKICESLFERFEDITTHLKTCLLKSSETVYLCGLCPDSMNFDSTELLKTHMLNVHKMKPNSSADENQNPVCVNESNKIDVVHFQRLLKNQVLTQIKFKCILKECRNKFASKEIMLKHLDCHYEGLKKFRCYICDKHFLVWRTCQNHMWSVHNVDVGLLECPICKKFKCLSDYKLLIHMKTHSIVQTSSNVRCSTCDKEFQSLEQLNSHIETHVNEKEGLVQCNICKEPFSNSKILKRHIQAVHAFYKPFICNICGHKSARKSMLEIHLRQHTGEKPYKCELCAFKTGDPNSFRRHTLRHSQKPTYSCQHCSYKTIQAPSLKVHIKSKHPGESGIFSCKNCPYSTINLKLYRSHVKKHDNATPKTTNATAEEKSQEKSGASSKMLNVEDEETQIGLFSEHLVDDAAPDTGGITIPAES